ncbi:MAG: type II secretion system F family protein [Candidatus Omnitrophica bacterium]|nr:type II secretion system F family protein [Candidatus Omnitrophota bacterium]
MTQTVSFTRNLADLVDGHISIIQSLILIHRQTKNPTLKAKMEKMIGVLQDGGMLSDALANFSQEFPVHYVQMVRSGELGGNLNEVLRNLASHLEKDEEVQGKVRAALIYPSIVLGLGALTMIVMLAWVIPKMSMILKDLGQTLPWITRALLGLSDFLVHWGWGIVFWGVGLFFAATRFYGRPAGRVWVDQKVLELPLLGKRLEDVCLGRWLRALAMLIKNGIPLMFALEASCGVIENVFLRGKLRNVLNEVEKGSNLSWALEKEDIFSESERTIVAIGEESGILPEALAKLVEQYERRLEASMREGLSLLEPILILIVAGMVAVMAMALLLPIMKMDVMVQ